MIELLTVLSIVNIILLIVLLLYIRKHISKMECQELKIDEHVQMLDTHLMYLKYPDTKE